MRNRRIITLSEKSYDTLFEALETLQARTFDDDFRKRLAALQKDVHEVNIDTLIQQQPINRSGHTRVLKNCANLMREVAAWLRGDEPYVGDTLAGALQEQATKAMLAALRPLRAKVEVNGGVAYLTKCPAGVTVEIQDHDNERHQ